MNWFSRLKSKLKHMRQCGEPNAQRFEYDIALYAQSKTSSGFHITDPQKSSADTVYSVANLSAYMRADGTLCGSLLFLEYRSDLADILNSVFDFAGRYLYAETGQWLGSCELAMRRELPLTEAVPLSDGILNICTDLLDDGGGRYLLRSISKSKYDAGLLADEHHTIITAASCA